MNTFKKKSLAAAIAGFGVLGLASTADAVYVNPDGLGQVLIYPYYTVRDKVAGAPFNSLLSVVNSTGSAKAVKVRFLEGKNSREVLDFNLYLSAKDVWTAAIVPTAGGAGIFTKDTSCTTPQVSSSSVNPTRFVNFAYAGDPAGGDQDRTKEGYIEIIEMGNLVSGSTAEAAVTHSGGVPKDCEYIGDDTIASNSTVLGNGGLFGGITLINVLAGEDITADAVALANWNTAGPLWNEPGSIKPNLTQGDVTYTVFNGTTALNGTANTGIDAVSAAMIHQDLMNEFVVEEVTKSQTSWVVTFPTKRYYYNEAAGQLCGTSQVACNQVQKLFQRNFVSTGACDDVILSQYSREEQKPSTPGGFSPPPPTGPKPALCWEANILTVNGGNVFGSANVSNFNTVYPSGWANINLVGGATAPVHTLATPSATFSGLPVIGFAAITFNNGTLSDAVSGKLVQSNYGGSFLHKYTSALPN